MVNVFTFVKDLFFALILFAVRSSSNPHGNELNGKHLIIATSPTAPYIYTDRDENGKLLKINGFVNELVLWLAVKYNFTFDYVEPKDGFIGAFVNNSWNGMVQMVINNEADLIAFPLTPSYARTLVIDFAIPFAIDPMVALIPPPHQDGKIIAVVKPFKPEVWVLIIVSMLCIAFVTWMTINLTNKFSMTHYKNTAELKFTKHILVAFGVISCQGQYLPQNVSHSTRIAAASWCLTSVVFVYLYSGCLISFMTIPKFRPIVETLDQLADSNELQVATLKTHFFESYLLEATSGTYKKLGDTIRRNPQNSLGTDNLEQTWKLAENAVSGRYAILLEKSLVLNVLEYYLKKTGKCGMSLMKEEFYQTKEAFAIPKGRSYLKLMDQGMNIMRDTGFIKYLHDNMTKINKCTAECSNPDRRKVPKLTSADLVGVFVLWLCGTAVSTVVFAFEILVSIASKLNAVCKT